MKHVILEGLDIAYNDAGSGKALLLVHGWGSNAQTFDGLSKALSARFRVIRPDLPGFGGSQAPKEAWTLDDYTRLLEALLKKLEITKLHGLIGHSLGGRISIRAQGTGHLPSDKLILLASHGIAAPNSPRMLFYKGAGKVAKLGLSVLPKKKQKSIKANLYSRLGSTDYMNTAPAMKETFQNIISQDLRADATKVQTDTLLIYGANDTVTPAKFGSIFAKRIPNARLEVIAEAEHYVHLDQPSKVTKTIEAFL